MATQATVKITVAEFPISGEGDEIPLSEIVGAIAKVPAEYAQVATFVVQGDSWERTVYGLNLEYTRPETDAERQKRERDEAETKALRQREIYERDAAEYARLKAKFEGRK